MGLPTSSQGACFAAKHHWKAGWARAGPLAAGLLVCEPSCIGSVHPSTLSLAVLDIGLKHTALPEQRSV